jgi:hypothetical protein
MVGIMSQNTYYLITRYILLKDSSSRNNIKISPNLSDTLMSQVPEKDFIPIELVSIFLYF